MKLSIKQYLLLAFTAILLLGSLMALAGLFQLNDLHEALLRQDDATGATIFRDSRILLLGLLALFLGTGSMLALFTYRSLVMGMEQVLRQVSELAQASRQGDLKRRLSTDQMQDDWARIANDINVLLDQALGPVNAQITTLHQIAQGNLSAHITEEFEGDHNRIKTAINQVSGIASTVVREFDKMMQDYHSGQNRQRIQAQQYVGDWHRMMLSVNSILDTVDQNRQELEQQNWIRTGLSELAGEMRSDAFLEDLALRTVAFLARYTDAQVGALYHWDSGEQALLLLGGYALERSGASPPSFAMGEGLVGQAAREKQLISVSDLPDNYTRIRSSTGSTMARHALLLPLLHQGELKGVLELARVCAFEPATLELLRRAASAMAAALDATHNNNRNLQLLQQTQQQAVQLQTQQEELQQTNEELEEQTQALQSSEDRLRMQQEELQQTNTELEERTGLLEHQRAEVLRQNQQLDQARIALQHQADALALASKYKSEFLSNMSHELRTPLNSLLLLARSLSDNREGNLSDKQLQAARVMHQSGNDLLAIINDILDLSKIEAGREVMLIGEMALSEFAEQLETLYGAMAQEKGLSFEVTLAEELPALIQSDRQRLGQILRNLLSNAFKFTQQGGVTLDITAATGPAGGPQLAFAVRDSGVGIALEKQQLIWEAFSQADGSTSREYGGTGLGLTISRELARLLGGHIALHSETGVGSTFTLYLPLDGTPALANQSVAVQPSDVAPRPPRAPHSKPLQAPQRIADDRATIGEDEVVILIVEDDPVFAQLLADVCHQHGMKYLACPTAEEAMGLIGQHAVKGVMLDMLLPDRDGWAVLSHIKEQLDTLHIPVYIISGEERNRQALQFGAAGFLQKPVSPEQLLAACKTISAASGTRVKSVLLVEDDAVLRQAVRELLQADDITIEEANSGAAALAALRRGTLDLLVLDLGLPDMSGFDLLKQARTLDGITLPPVIVFTGRELSGEEYEQLQGYSANVIIKGVRSDERLVEEAALFLHRQVATLPERARKMLVSLRDRDALFNGMQVLLVDDDIRNVFSLSGLLEARGLKVITAKNGQEALDKLAQNPAIHMLLTDIMMPVMDGFELIRRVRAQKPFSRLPILALTAKAMKEDRDRCLQAGASDYLSKPIDVDRLLSVMRVWLYR
jgi:CheY-like chemotaxis protein